MYGIALKYFQTPCAAVKLFNFVLTHYEFKCTVQQTICICMHAMVFNWFVHAMFSHLKLIWHKFEKEKGKTKSFSLHTFTLIISSKFTLLIIWHMVKRSFMSSPHFLILFLLHIISQKVLQLINIYFIIVQTILTEKPHTHKHIQNVWWANGPFLKSIQFSPNGICHVINILSVSSRREKKERRKRT